MNFFEMNPGNLNEHLLKLNKRYAEFKAQKLSLDMSRGKPCPQQLDLSMEILNCCKYISRDGIDGRNYGGIDGLAEIKELFSRMFEISEKEIIIGGNSSLNLMYDTIVKLFIKGAPGSTRPWKNLPAIKFLCPSPGYDRHFAICEYFNIQMIPVEMKEDGPDMDTIEKLVSSDESIKGMWCVPKYSNPTGITYSDSVVDRLARMRTKAEDFRIFWDNAYAVHYLYAEHDNLKNILTACKEAGNDDRVYIFSSTSKISFAGAGISMLAASENNVNDLKRQIAVQTVGLDKLNQLRHIDFFQSLENVENHMKKHADVLRPKFQVVLEKLEAELGEKNIACWSKPKGGYFISLNTLDGCAKLVVDMAAGAGVTLTKAGATFPYGVDPRDRNIRIAPSFPSLTELEKAIEILCICIQIVSIQKIIKVGLA